MIEVYEPNSGSSLMVDYTNLTKQQLKMVFSKNNIRDIGGQRNYYETELNRKEKVKEEQESLGIGKDYSITAGMLFVKSDTNFTKKQLKNIICKMYGVEKISDIKD
jgi:chaperonin cofactor prefoldin